MSPQESVKTADLPWNRDHGLTTDAEATHRATVQEAGNRKASTHDPEKDYRKRSEVATHRVELN